MNQGELNERLHTAAMKAVGEPVQFVTNTPIVETFQGKIVWEGVVSEFMTTKCQHVYVWAVDADPEPQYVTVLKEPPVKDALTAVRGWCRWRGNEMSSPTPQRESRPGRSQEPRQRRLPPITVQDAIAGMRWFRYEATPEELDRFMGKKDRQNSTEP